MPVLDPLQPLELSKRLHIPLTDVSQRLDITEAWLRRLAKIPRHRRRILVAELTAALEQERLALSLESLLPPGARI